MRLHHGAPILVGLVVLALTGALFGAEAIRASRGAAAPRADVVCPEGQRRLFPLQNVNIPAVPPWSFPAYAGEKALEPLPDAFDIVERDAWFDGVPATIRPFPRPSVGDGGPEDNHADMYVFFYPDGTPVNQLPLLEAVPRNAIPAFAVPEHVEARMFSANWEVHVVRVAQDYVPGSIRSILDITNPRWVLEEIQTNIFITFPILPQRFTIPGLALNGLSVEAGMFEGHPVPFVEYDLWDNEYTKKPLYLFRKPSGAFVGNAVLSGIPGMPHYSALWEVFFVEVPADYVADTLRSEDAVLASGFAIRDGFEVFAPVESVDGMRTRFRGTEDVLREPDGKFHIVEFPKQEAFPDQPWLNDPRFSPATLGFTRSFNQFSFNEVFVPRLQALPAAGAAEDALGAALLGQAPDLCAKIVVPPHIARQRLIEDANGALVHLDQADLDNRPLAELVSRGQALFEREFSANEGAGPAFNAPSCATCHGLPFNLAVEPTAGGPGVRFRNALQPTESPDKTSRNTPHVFGSGVLTQLGIERHAGGQPVTDDNANPHNWKGNVPTVRAFTAGALKGEIGLESVEKVAEMAGVSLAEAAALDPDNDGLLAEMTVGDVTAMTAFQASLPRPYQIDAADSGVIRGRQVFLNTGCATCHQPVQVLQSTILDLTNPETAGVARVPLGSPEVELFSDLKRHKMGPLLAEPGAQGGIPADVFKTKELWGVGDSSPYLHNGSVDTLEEAIAKHRGQPLESLQIVSVEHERVDANTFRLHLSLVNRSTAPVDLAGLLLVLTSAPAGVTPVDADGGPAGVGATWTVAGHLEPGAAGPIPGNGSVGAVVQYRTDSGQPATNLRFKASTQQGYSEAMFAIEAFNALSGGQQGDLVRFLKSLVLPRREDLELAALNLLTAGDRTILGPTLRSFVQVLTPGPLLFAWIVNPPPEGASPVKGGLKVQVSIIAETSVDAASVIVDGTTVLPLAYNPASGFYEANLDTKTLAEGDHRLSLDVQARGRPDDRHRGATTSVITVDNVRDVQQTPPNIRKGKCLIG
ncbi:MAG: hypothetical protein HY683_06010 [Chloroflexi bacterium]|nr:hypothetical protein [Chloroflexota bacterium]